MLSTLDAVYAEIARLETSALHLIAGLETTGHAQELGAGTTARLLTFRYRIDATKARRDVHLATSLQKFPAVAAALPNPNPHSSEPDHDDEHGADADCADVDGAGVDGAGVDRARAGVGVLLHPAQAEAIVSALDKVPATVAPDDLRVAERATGRHSAALTAHSTCVRPADTSATASTPTAPSPTNRRPTTARRSR